MREPEALIGSLSVRKCRQLLIVGALTCSCEVLVMPNIGVRGNGLKSHFLAASYAREDSPPTHT